MTVTVEGYASMECKMIVGYTRGEIINWTWKLVNSAGERLLNSSDSRITITNSGTNNSTSKITVRSIKDSDTGDLVCIVDNGNGNYSQTVNLRVKSRINFKINFLIKKSFN